MTDPKERRAHTRTDVRLTAGVRRSGEGDALSVTTLNVSAGGVYVEVPRFIEPLTKLEIELELPGPGGARRLATEAIVVRTQPEQESADATSYEVACAFLGLTEEHREALQHWLAAHKGAPAR